MASFPHRHRHTHTHPKMITQCVATDPYDFPGATLPDLGHFHSGRDTERERERERRTRIGNELERGARGGGEGGGGGEERRGDNLLSITLLGWYI